jgi:pantoate--beta-alanine ligase
MEVLETRKALTTWRSHYERVAFVPTMGALHEGHAALVRAARTSGDPVLVSIFVNPTQFSANEDLSKYPRPFEEDCALLEKLGVDAVYAPSVEDMYPAGSATFVVPEGAALVGLEDAFRPQHFRGVATVVQRLFAQTKATSAYFGEKDYQQLCVIRQMVRDLSLEVEIHSVPTVRDYDGLALSSRNSYLPPKQRKIAPKLLKIMQEAKRLMQGALECGEQEIEAVLSFQCDLLREAGFVVEYLSLRDAVTLDPIKEYTSKTRARLLAAVRLPNARLIDNIKV